MTEIKLTKHSIAEIEKCYAVCPTTLRGKKGFLLATEKAGGCFFFDLQGKLVEQRKAEQGHKRQPDKRDHGPGPKSVFERLLGASAPDGVYEFGQEPERAEP